MNVLLVKCYAILPEQSNRWSGEHALNTHPLHQPTQLLVFLFLLFHHFYLFILIGVAILISVSKRYFLYYGQSSIIHSSVTWVDLDL